MIYRQSFRCFVLLVLVLINIGLVWAADAGDAALPDTPETVLAQYGTIINGKRVLTEEGLTKYLMDKKQPKVEPYKSVDKFYASSPGAGMSSQNWQSIKHTLASADAGDAVAYYGNGETLNKNQVQGYLSAGDTSGGASDGVGKGDDPLAKVFPEGLKLSKSSTTPTTATGSDSEGSPAQFGWVDASHGKESYNIDGALSYNVDIGGTQNQTQKMLEDWKHDLFGSDQPLITFAPAIEAHVSDNPSATQNSIAASVPLKLFTSDDANGNSHYFYVAPVYQMDYKAETKTYGGSFLYSPSISDAYIGVPPQNLHFGPIPIYPSWRPYAGVESGYASQEKSKLLREGSYGRLVFQLHGQVFFTKYVELSADYYHRIFIGDGPFVGDSKENFDYVEGDATIWLDPAAKHFSVGLTYKDGRTSPQFQRVQSLNAFVGLKF